jgi:hypothetical protein
MEADKASAPCGREGHPDGVCSPAFTPGWRWG